MSTDFQCQWDIDRVYEMIRTIAEDIPDRLPGTDAARRMAEFSCAELGRAGVAAAVHPVHALVSIPKPAVLKVLAPVELEIPALTMAHSPNTAEPITARLYDVGLGRWEDFDGLPVEGQVTLSELSYAPPRQEKQRIAGLRGSCAQVMMNWGYPDSEELPMGSVKPGWGNPTRDTMHLSEASVPCMGISRKHGEVLRRLCREGPVTVMLQTRADTGWRDIHVTVGEIPCDAGADFAMAGGHQDGWFGAAATDNASGSAILVELARVFAENAPLLRRGLTVGFWAGHETGTMAGSAWWADRNWDRLRDHAVGYLQIDQPACAGTFGWSVTSNHEMRDLAVRVQAETDANAEIAWAPQVKNGDSSFFGVGVPMMVAHSHFPDEELARTANAAYGWWHHTRRNDLDKIDRGLLKWHLDTYAAYLRKLTMDPVLPQRFAPLGEALAARLGELLPLDDNDRIGLRGLCAEASRLHGTLRGLDAAADGLAQGTDRDRGRIDAMNERLKRLSRILIPIMSTAAGRYGHDPYGLTAQTTVIPGLYAMAEYAATAPGAAREMLWVELARARNRVSDAIAEAAAVCAGA
ncbi:MAG: M28 family peptidase [Hyphomicrobiales bacterium]|nr:M28 family peptidase [Hyphomicrobiales bacterium]